jgi:Fe-S-cluster-containing hydrogenase component 2
MGFDPVEKKVFKCDLCDGDPQCVRFCDEKAVDYVEVTREPLLKKRDAAEKIAQAHKRGLELSQMEI